MIEDENLVCECGCGESMRWSGHGRRPHYVNEAHKQAAYRNRNKFPVTNFDFKILDDNTCVVRMKLTPDVARRVINALESSDDERQRIKDEATNFIQRLKGGR